MLPTAAAESDGTVQLACYCTCEDESREGSDLLWFITGWGTGYRRYVNACRSLKGRDAITIALAGGTGQFLVLFFGLQTLVFMCIHAHQLLMDTRYVNAAHAPQPHESLTLRVVRVVDFLVCLVWSSFLGWLFQRLRQRAISSVDGRRLLLASFRCGVYVYTLGTMVDFAQCHFQAGGIGPSCNGYNCAQTALILASSALVGEYKPDVFWAVCFLGQGLYRLVWAWREERPTVVKVSISTTAAILILLSLSLYAEEIVYWRVATSKRQEEEEDVEQGVLVDASTSSYMELKAVLIDARKRDPDDSMGLATLDEEEKEEEEEKADAEEQGEEKEEEEEEEGEEENLFRGQRRERGGPRVRPRYPGVEEEEEEEEEEE